ncbi:MAG TPA: branched-chain amino acid ABC transporter permease, partial [Mycobacterium sp.]|nr:branched-chain amino acid ABC transporter permease [Mycobacterium sp.]
MIDECIGHCAVQAADIGFNLAALRAGFWQLTIDGLSWGAIYALVAVGYTLVFGVLRLINFAHSEIFMLGMFGAYFALDMILGFTSSGNAYHVGVVLTVVYLAVAMLFAMAVSGSAALGLEAIAYRPLRRRHAKPLTFLITAIGMSFVLQELVHFILPQLLPGYGGSNAQPPIILVVPRTQFTVFGAMVSNVTLVIVAAACVLAVLTDMAINRTKFGRGIRAVAQDPTTATLMGVSRERIIMATFVIGGVLAGAAALLYTL